MVNNQMILTRLNHKINFAIIITFIFVALLFISIQLPFQKMRLNSVMGKINLLLETLIERDKEQLANEIFEKRTQAIKERITEMLKVEGLSGINVYDKAGKLIISEGINTNNITLNKKDLPFNKNNALFMQETINNNLFLSYIKELFIIGECVGFIKIYYNLNQFQKHQIQSYGIFLSLLFSILVIMIIILNLFISKMIIKPIRYIREAMNIISKGNLGKKVEVKNKDEIGELAKSFNEMSLNLKDSYYKIEKQNRDLKKLDRIKDDFLTNTSHELKTPLNNISEIVDSIISGDWGQLSKKAVDNLNMVNTSTKRLSSLVNDILDFSKMNDQSISLSLKVINLKQVVNYVYELSKPLTKSKNIKITNNITDQLPLVLADYNRLIQILHNIIGNAIKYNKENGTVNVEAFQISKTKIKVSIIDTGIGIPEDKQEDIFKSFEQLENSETREFGGAGLGLSITKTLIEAHGEKIGVISSKDNGSTIYFTLTIADKDQISDENIDKKIVLDTLDKPINIDNSKSEEELNSDKTTDIETDTIVDEKQVKSDNYNNKENENDINESDKELNSNIESISDEENGADVSEKKLKLNKDSEKEKESNSQKITQNNPDITMNNESTKNDQTANSEKNNDIVKQSEFPDDDSYTIKIKGLEILAVDDDDSNLMVINNYLTDQDCNVTTATSGREAISLIEKQNKQFDIMLIDIMMPQMNGFELTREIRKKYTFFEVPIIMITALSQPKNIVKGFSSGVNDFLIKPFFESELYVRIDTHINISKTYKEMQVNIDLQKKELDIAKESSELASQAKSDFLANISHEIRTPMNGVLTAAELAMAFDLPPKVEHYLKIIHSSGHTLLGIINDILDFSTIDSGKLTVERQPFRFDEFLIRISDLFGAKASEKGIEFLIDCNPQTPVCLVGDALRIQQVLTNLISNAIKFTRNKGVVTLGIFPKDIKENYCFLHFYVKDTGVGIKKDILKTLFDPFTQEDGSKTRKFGGTGLGLTICKQLIELMGGEIWVESEYNKGTTFHFTIYFDIEDNKDYQPLIIPPEISNLKVLIVDDTSDSRLIIKKIVESFNYKAITVDSGDNALKYLQNSENEKVDVIVMDWVMPGTDGIETSRIIREELELTIPIIMLTSFGNESEKRDAEQVGIDAFLSKPIHSSSLFNTLIDVLYKNSNIKFKQNNIATRATVYKKRIKGLNILLVEDNITNQDIALALLEDAGLNCDVANNGKEGVEQLKNNYYDIILMDVQMPEMDGFEATKMIREMQENGELKHLKNDRIPIIAMTAHAMKGDDVNCFQAGMDAYVAKPINQDILFHTIWNSSNKSNLEKNKKIKSLIDNSDETPKQEKNMQSLEEDQTEKDNNKEEEKGMPPTKVAGINIKESLDNLNIDYDTYKRILKRFRNNNLKTMDEIYNNFKENKMDILNRIFHTLKGSGGNIGAHKLRSISQKLEVASKEGFVDLDMIKELEDVLNVVLNSIKNLDGEAAEKTEDNKENDKQTKTVEIDLIKIKPLIKKLKDTIDLGEPDQIRDYYEELKSLLHLPEISKLNDYIEGFDYDEALECLEEIAEKIGIEK